MNKPIHDDNRSEPLDERAALRADVRVAEEQIARGEASSTMRQDSRYWLDYAGISISLQAA
jgi:hypothetical protein